MHTRLKSAERLKISSGVLLLNRVCPLTSKNIQPQEKFPGTGPPDIPYLQYRIQKSGACSGEGLAGGGLEGPASP